MAKTLLREKAIQLRRGGWSIRDVASTLRISRGTASYWCRDIRLSQAQIEYLTKRQYKASIGALFRSAENRRQLRMSKTKALMLQGAGDAGDFTERDLFIGGLTLYWAEGYKKGNGELGFTNSDPEIIQFIIKWLGQNYSIKQENLVLRVSINQVHKQRSNEIMKYWSQITGVPITQFTKTSFIQSKIRKIYTHNENYFGTLRVKVRKGTDLRRRIMGAIQAVAQKVDALV